MPCFDSSWLLQYTAQFPAPILHLYKLSQQGALLQDFESVSEEEQSDVAILHPQLFSCAVR